MLGFPLPFLFFSFFIFKIFHCVLQLTNNDHSSIPLVVFRYCKILNVPHALKGLQPERANGNAREMKLNQQDINIVPQTFLFPVDQRKSKAQVHIMILL